MELRQWKYFLKVAELRNFSEASRQLNITQSTLSQQIKKLEGEMNVTLLLRDSHHVMLTDIGEAILPSVEKTIRDANACADIIRDVQNLNTGTLNIGATQSFSLLLRETIMEFCKQYPGVKLNVHCQPMEMLIDMLDKEDIDIALCYRSTTPLYDTIESHILFDNKLSVVVSDTHPLATRKSIRIEELERHFLALPAIGTQARSTFDNMIKDSDLKFNIGMEVSAIHMLLDIVRGTRYVTLLSSATISQYSGLKSIPIENEGCGMEGSYNIRKGTYMKKATKQFLKLLCEKNSYNMAFMYAID